MSVNATYLDDGATYRCQGLTKSKTQCKKAATFGTEFCAQHYEQQTVESEPEQIENDAPAAKQYHRPGVNEHPNLAENAAKRRLQRGGGVVAGFQPINRGQRIQSPRGAARKAKRAAKAARTARGNKASAR